MDQLIRALNELFVSGGYWWFTGWIIRRGEGECDGDLVDQPISVRQRQVTTFEWYDDDGEFDVGDLDGTWRWLGEGDHRALRHERDVLEPEEAATRNPFLTRNEAGVGC